MYKTINADVKKLLVKNGYKWNEISITPYLGYCHLYGVKLDGKLVEVYDTRKMSFVD